MDLFKEIIQWRDEYAALLGCYELVDQLKGSLLVDEMSTVSCGTRYTLFQLLHFLFQTLMSSHTGVEKIGDYSRYEIRDC